MFPPPTASARPLPPPPPVSSSASSSSSPSSAASFPPPPSFSSSPESIVASSVPDAPAARSYQGHVPGLQGWNDPPPLLNSASSISSSRRPGGSRGPPAANTKKLEDVAVVDGAERPSCAVDPGPPLTDEEVRQALTTAMETVRVGVVDPTQKRIIDDTSKRLDELHERLREGKLPTTILDQLRKLAKGLDAFDMKSAGDASMTLTLMSTTHSSESRWILGTKRLVELRSRISS